LLSGWFLDVIVEYLYRVIVRAVKTRGIAHWRTVKAIVNDSACLSATLGCHVAEVYYEFRPDGEIYTGIDEKPFIFNDSCKSYAGRFSKGVEIVIRLKPGDPSVSYLREVDQGLTV
jgi:hypothetical protein